METQLPVSRDTSSPQFLAHICCGQNGWMDQDATWYESRLRPRPYCVRWRPSSPSKKGHSSPQFSAHVYCAQTAGWIKMPPGTKVGLVPGHIVLDEDPAPPKGHSSPLFSAHAYCGQTVAHLSYCWALVMMMMMMQLVGNSCINPHLRLCLPFNSVQFLSVSVHFTSVLLYT